MTLIPTVAYTATPMAAFHEVLTAQMRRRKIDAPTLADCVGVHRATVYKWMKGEVVPWPWRIASIADCLGMSRLTLMKPLVEQTERVEQPQRLSAQALERRISELQEELRKREAEYE